MKKVLFFIFAVLIGSSVFAQSLELTTNTNNLDINNPLQVTITIADAPQGGVIGIKGFQENFDIVSRSQSQSIQIINGKRSASTQFQIQAKAKKTGEFTIGPAQLQVGTGIIQSNTVNVKVSGEKLFVNGAPPGWQNNPPPSTNTINNGTLNTPTNTTHANEIAPSTKPEKTVHNKTPSWLIFLLAGLTIFLVIIRQKRKQEKGNEYQKNDTITKQEHDQYQAGDKSGNHFAHDDTKIAGNTHTQSAPKIQKTQRTTSLPRFPRKNEANYPTKLEQRIRGVIGNKLHKDTASLTFEELHTLRAKAHGKDDKAIHDAIENNTCTLYQILQLLEQSKYANKEINLEDLHQLAKNWKKSIKE